MKEDLTDITMIVGASGSMSDIWDDTIGGIKGFIANMQKMPGNANLTVYAFNLELKEMLATQDIKLPVDLTSISPNGWTALLDAVGKVIERTGRRLDAIPENERPAKVVFVISTDGLENSSHKFSKEMIRDMIDHQTTKYNWQFVFTGANQDSYLSAGSLGFQSGAIRNYDATHTGVSAMYCSVTDSMTAYRQAPVGASFSFAQCADEPVSQKPTA